MLSIQTLIRLADEYERAAQVPASTLSWRVFGDTKKLTAIRAGKDIQVGRYEKALRWFSENWPADAVWPEDIARTDPAVPA
jgi:hypothetical protein